MEYNVYCDESCHLENDGQRTMVLGAIWVLKDKAAIVAEDLRVLRTKHGLATHCELKWNKVSPSKLAHFVDVVDYFFNNPDLHFRAVVIADKEQLRHDRFSQDHNTWYYKMYFTLLTAILSPEHLYRVYLDIKDTRGGSSIRKLQEVLAHKMYDFDQSIVNRIQLVRSHEVSQIQLADLFVGAVRYANAGLVGSPAKRAVVERIRSKSGYSLTRSTLLREPKMNIFIWHGSQSPDD